MHRLVLLSLLWLARCGSADHDVAVSASSSAEFGPPIAQNPWSAPSDFATQHGDSGASDTSTLPGPGASAPTVARLDLLAVCPSILPLRSGLAIAVCTKLLTRTPNVVLIDPDALAIVAQRELTKGAPFGGVYPYLDEQERLVIVDGANNLLRLDTDATLGVVQTTPLPIDPEDGVVGLLPDYQGRDWFATGRGLVGTITRDGATATFRLPNDEHVANSIASAPSGVAVVSDHALYLMKAEETGAPSVRARVAYERGDARKPGQLSWGSGTTPTFFGPHTGSDYVAITDNARPMNLIVVRNDGAPICTLEVPRVEGTENSPIGTGRSVILASTFGFSYPALPEGLSAAVPAPFTGGMARIDVDEDEQGCSVVWTNTARSVSVPKLSLADGLIYTLTQTDHGYALSAIDAVSGTSIAEHELPGAGLPMQLAPTLAPRRTLLQGMLSSILRITP
ncbi:MAG TPA: hypothetical protein VI299_29380 [Polyangiales bacterium]